MWKPALVAAALSLTLSACGAKDKDKKPPRPASVGVVIARLEPVPVSTELAGRVTATLASDVRPQVDGIVLDRLFTEGAAVRKGQALYRIDPRPYRAARDQAAAALSNTKAAAALAQVQAQRYQSLAATQAVSRAQIDQAVATARQSTAQVEQAAATLRTAEINLNYTTVRAPISGRIGRSAVTPGALVTANQTTSLASIQTLDPIYVDIVQPSDALIALRQSLRAGSLDRGSRVVKLTLSSGQDYPLTGRLEFAETVVDPTSGTVTLRARVPNPQDLLLPGLFVRVTVPQGVVPNAILVPQRGVARTPKGDATVLVAAPDDTVKTVPVTVAQAVGNKWLVTKGLKAGDRVIVDGIIRAKPGARVRPSVAKDV